MFIQVFDTESTATIISVTKYQLWNSKGYPCLLNVHKHWISQLKSIMWFFHCRLNGQTWLSTWLQQLEKTYPTAQPIDTVVCLQIKVWIINIISARCIANADDSCLSIV